MDLINTNSLINTLLSKSSWGRNELKALHIVYGPMLYDYTLNIDKTTISTKDVIEALYRFVCINRNYSYPNQFEDELKALNKTMIGKEQLQSFLISFLDVNFDDHPTLEAVCDDVYTSVKSNNSYKVIIMSFKQSFIKHNI